MTDDISEKSPQGSGTFDLKDVLRVAVIALAYFLTLFLSFLFPDTKKVFMTIWPAGGVGLAAFLLSPRRLWPMIAFMIFMAGNTANFLQYRPLFNSLGFMVANVLESLGCAWLISRVCGPGVTFNRVRDILALLAGATLVNGATACIGAGVAAWSTRASFGSFWLSWWIVDGLGILIVTPLIMLWSDHRRILSGLRRSRLVEVAAFIAVWCSVSWLAFNRGVFPASHFISSYVPVALLVWPALRFGQRGVIAALALLALIGVSSLGVSVGAHLWGGSTWEELLLLFQFYMACTAVMGMTLAASFAESRDTAEKLRQSRELLDAVINGTTDAVYVKDLQGRYLMFNAAAAKAVGKPVEDVLGRDDRSLFTSTEASQIMEGDRRVLEAGQVKTYEEVIADPSGGVRTFLSTKGPVLDSKGTCVGLFGVARDITERKVAEKLAVEIAASRAATEVAQKRAVEVEESYRELQKTQTMLVQSEKMAALGVLSAGVAHELNNPLTGILGIARHYISGKKPEDRDFQDLTKVVQAGERMAKIIKGLLTFSRPSVGEAEDVNCNLVIDTVLAFGEGIMVGSGIHVNKFFADDLPLVRADKNRLEQVMIVIINNAVDAMKKKGELKISTRRVALANGVVAVEVEIADDGCGIRKADMDRIFDPFFTTKEPGKGTGLGLSVAYAIVSDYKGDILVKSPPEGQKRGASFTVRLPAKSGA
ncbi:MAG: MASE1 domain-containing protein [Candidatus Omnitrophota bacterium]